MGVYVVSGVGDARGCSFGGWVEAGVHTPQPRGV